MDSTGRGRGECPQHRRARHHRRRDPASFEDYLVRALAPAVAAQALMALQYNYLRTALLPLLFFLHRQLPRLQRPIKADFLAPMSFAKSIEYSMPKCEA